MLIQSPYQPMTPCYQVQVKSFQQLLAATHSQKPVRQAEQLLGFFPTPSIAIQPHFAPLPSLSLTSPLKCCLCSPVLKRGSLCNNSKPMQPSMQPSAHSLHLPCDCHSLPVGPARSTCPAVAGTAGHKALVADTDPERMGLSHNNHGRRLLAVGTGSKAGVMG